MTTTPNISSHFGLYNLLLGEPGLRLPLELRSRNATINNLGILADGKLLYFLGIGSPVTGSWSRPYIVSRICHILETVEDAAETSTHYHDWTPESDALLSDAHLRSIERQFGHGIMPGAMGSAANTLGGFLRFLLATRRDWMMINKGKWRDPPRSILEARVHSCLMILKKAEMRGFVPSTVLGNDRWLAFEGSEFEIEWAVEACQKAFPR